MKFRYKLAISATIGIFMGFILPRIVAYDFFTRSSLSLIPWSIAGIIVCYSAINRKQSILMGMSYVAFLAESFLFLGQLKFNSEPILVLIFLLIVLIVSLICGTVMGLTVYYFKKLVNRN